MIKINSLKYSYSKFSVDLNCEIISSNIIGIIGKSGSGKSTFINLFSGFLKPNSGTILLDNLDITFLKPHQRNLSVLFQDHNNFDHLSIFENIILGIDPSMKKSDENIFIVKEIMKKISLNFDIDKRVSELSGGEQQRVSIARCLIRNKPFLLLDEPFNSLDPGLRKKLYLDIKSMSLKNSLTTLISSHLIDELILITNSFLFLHQGKIVENKIMTYEDLCKNDLFKEYLQ
tara:strand:+ start:4779 stop:5471 length:693 start_codon:yes stop_codon:yes gene_type:complete